MQNASDLPIYDVVVIMPADNESLQLVNHNVGMVGAGRRESISGGPGLSTEYTRASPMAFVFRDSGGRRWLRDGMGILYDGTRKNLDRLDYPWGIVDGSEAARRLADSLE